MSSVAFEIEFRPGDLAYLAGLDEVPETAKARFFERCRTELGEASQEFRDARRQQGDTTRFEHGILLADENGRVHYFRLIVDDSPASYGVLRILYVDHQTGRLLP